MKKAYLETGFVPTSFASLLTWAFIKLKEIVAKEDLKIMPFFD